MVTPDQVSWGSYREYEGPFCRGSVSYTPPANPTEDEKILATVTAVEGGRFDAINGYDKCIISAGIIQWCELQYSVSEMLGAVAAKSPQAMQALKPALDASGAEFKQNQRGRWRFFFKDARGEVDRPQEQHQLFQLHCDGSQGTWDGESKARGKLWAAAVSNVLAHPDAQKAQIAFTVPRLYGFSSAMAREMLWGASEPQHNDHWVGAVRTGFIAFAINNPAIASNMLKEASTKTGAPKWSPDWCIEVFRQMTFGPDIAIYPRRYNGIRPCIEKFYGVDLPDFADDLMVWHAQHGIDTTLPTFTDVKEIQEELIHQGYDIGPAGADGVYGGKTKSAVLTFQGLHKLPATGLVDPATRAAFVAEWQKRNA
jgi:hypothetical protein